MNIWFYVIIAIIVLNYALSSIVKLLNVRALQTELPSEMNGFYDQEKYKNSQLYTRTNTKFSILTSTFSFLIIILMLALKGFAFVDSIAQNISPNSPILNSLIFLGIIFLGNFILSLPFDIYDTFVIEKKFGFNKTTPKIFVGDTIKNILLSVIIGGGILTLIIKFYTMTTEMFWLYAWLLVAGFSIFMFLFYSNLIVPLFNQQTPLPEGELRNKIEDFANKTGFTIKNIYQINGSKRSTKANAYFTGFGSQKRIVLYDTLIEQMTENEIVAVLAHEIGHYKKNHTLKSLIVSILNIGFVLYLFSLFAKYPQISAALGVETIKFHIALIAFSILFSPISRIINMFANIFSRKNEYQADNFAKENGLSKDLILGLKKLSANNLSNLTPHKLNVFFNYSHPPVLERIKNLKK